LYNNSSGNAAIRQKLGKQIAHSGSLPKENLFYRPNTKDFFAENPRASLLESRLRGPFVIVALLDWVRTIRLLRNKGPYGRILRLLFLYADKIVNEERACG
jgi:hypothetical protein